MMDVFSYKAYNIKHSFLFIAQKINEFKETDKNKNYEF